MSDHGEANSIEERSRCIIITRGLKAGLSPEEAERFADLEEKTARGAAIRMNLALSDAFEQMGRSMEAGSARVVKSMRKAGLLSDD